MLVDRSLRRQLTSYLAVSYESLTISMPEAGQALQPAPACGMPGIAPLAVVVRPPAIGVVVIEQPARAVIVVRSAVAKPMPMSPAAPSAEVRSIAEISTSVTAANVTAANVAATKSASDVGSAESTTADVAATKSTPHVTTTESTAHVAATNAACEGVS
jgi:hypothetical protein